VSHDASRAAAAARHAPARPPHGPLRQQRLRHRTNPKVTGTSVAFAGQAANAQLLHDALAEENIRVSS